MTEGDHMTVVFFHIEWCVPCRAMFSIVENVAKMSSVFNGDIRIGSVNCGDFPKLCESENVSAFPSLVHYRDGNELPEGRMTGVLSARVTLFLVKNFFVVNRTKIRMFCQVFIFLFQFFVKISFFLIIFFLILNLLTKFQFLSIFQFYAKS